MRSLLLLLLLKSFLSAEYIAWIGSYERAHQHALQEDKSLLILLLPHHCNHQCYVDATQPFLDQKNITLINKSYVGVIIKQDQEDSFPIELLYTLEYPSLFFLDKYELSEKEAIRGVFDAKRLYKSLSTD